MQNQSCFIHSLFCCNKINSKLFGLLPKVRYSKGRQGFFQEVSVLLTLFNARGRLKNNGKDTPNNDSTHYPTCKNKITPVYGEKGQNIMDQPSDIFATPARQPSS
ncbi:hypothetical protein [Neisseria weaveri]|uniref:hypothetical protein n=1 Tax=Neisseria weaveri TaxID=28091 RepID=UPI001F43C03F|nr:hypothetical protein [Neisseria weaveri]